MRGRSPAFWIVSGAVGLHALAIICSEGYQSADEYFQILEFLGFHLGRTPLSDMPIEYGEKMRPWLQPLLLAQVAKGLAFLGVDNPFDWTLVFRALGAALGLTAMREWGRSLTLKRDGALGLALFWLCWFYPVLHVRPSSESWASSVFWWGAGILMLRDGLRAWTLVLAGALLGLSFEFRFQMGLMIAPLLLGLWVQKRLNLRESGTVMAGFGAVFALGRVADAIGYGEWVLSPWRYFDFNLVRGKVDEFNVSPWWDLLRMSATETWPLLGTLTLGVLLFWIVKKPKHLVTWVCVPFLLIHCAIGHKELRFFYPIAHIVPWLGVLLLREMPEFKWTGFKRALVGYQALAAFGLSVVPLSRTVVWMRMAYEAIEESSSGQVAILSSSKDPYEILGTQTHFYRHPKGAVQVFPNEHSLVERLSQTDRPFLIFSDERGAKRTRYGDQGCQWRGSTLPQGLLAFESSWLSRANVFSLYLCAQQSETSETL